MEAIPETIEAIRNYGPFVVEHEDLLAELLSKAERVQALVPHCTGISLASNKDGISFTVVATAAEVAVLDAMQYVDSGPCVEAVEVDQVVEFDRDTFLGEDRWQLFAQATSALAVASTLTLPLRHGSDVVGSVNLYASTHQAFTGHHQAIADIFGAWAPGAVTNADLSFSTRATAEQAPRRLREDIDIHVALAAIARAKNVDTDAAHCALREAAQRAGLHEAVLAKIILELGDRGESDDGV